MHDLTSFSLADMSQCGAALRQLSPAVQTMEQAAGDIVRYLYAHLIDKDTGEKACPLVRFFKTHPYHDLDPELREFARARLAERPRSQAFKCLTLLASAGLKPEWNSRNTSTEHKAIPLTSEEMVAQFPMISNLIEQFGLEVGALLEPDEGILADLETRTCNVFLVPEAVGNPLVPAQDGFVIPFGIESVLGFGGLLPSGDLFAVIMFSRVPVSRETAAMFRTLALAVKVAVLPFAQAVFRSQGEAVASREGALP